MLYRCTMIIRCANRRLVAHAEYRLHRKWLHTRRPTSSAAFNYNSQHTTRCIIMIVCHIYTKSYICIVFLFLVRNGMVVHLSLSLLVSIASLLFIILYVIYPYFCDLPWFISLWYCNVALWLIAMTPNRATSHHGSPQNSGNSSSAGSAHFYWVNTHFTKTPQQIQAYGCILT